MIILQSIKKPKNSLLKFINPYFLIALISVAIPIIIHLFNFRKFRKVFFTNVRFLKELKQETQKKSKLKHLLVLISRILAVICLVLAFAQPYIPITDKTINARGALVSVYIDNSFSMQLTSTGGTMLDEAKKKALEISSVYKSTDQFQLLTNDFEGKHQRFVTKDEFEEMVKEVTVSASVRTIADVIQRQNELFSTHHSKDKISYLISDYQKTTNDFKQIKPDSNITTYLIPINSGKNSNAFIDSCWFESPAFRLNQEIKITVRIKNNSDTPLEKIPVKLSINHQQRAVASIDVGANSEAEVSIPFTIKEKGIQQGVVEILDFPVTFDDSFYFSFSVSDNIPVLSVNGNGDSPYINSLFRKDSSITFSNANDKSLDYSIFPAQSLIILNNIKNISTGLAQELKQYVLNGGSLLVFPDINANISSYQTFLNSLNAPFYSALDTVNTRVTAVNTDHFVYANVFEKIPENIDLPVVYSHFPINRGARTDAEYLLKLQHGEYFLCSQSCGKGKLFLSAVPLDITSSSFPKNWVFAPTIFNIALYSATSPTLFYFIGKDETFETKASSISDDGVFRITDKKNNFEIIPEHRIIDMRNTIFIHNQIKNAGNYILSAAGKDIEGISFNFNRTESDMKFFTNSEINNQIKEHNLKNFSIVDTKNKTLTQAIEELNQGIRLWKLFIILTLLFIAIEIILLRFWK